MPTHNCVMHVVSHASPLRDVALPGSGKHANNYVSKYSTIKVCVWKVPAGRIYCEEWKDLLRTENSFDKQ